MLFDLNQRRRKFEVSLDKNQIQRGRLSRSLRIFEVKTEFDEEIFNIQFTY
jgi:hypothetical protein